MIIDINNKKEWQNKYLQLDIEQRDIQYKLEYLEIFSKHENSEPLLFFYENNDGFVYYPFLKRKIFETEYYDITSQYGYGGPLYKVKGNKTNLLSEFRKKFNIYCDENNIISEFIRFHPMIKNYKGLDFDMECINISEVIYVDLTKSEEEILKNYKYNNRKSINKAIRAEVETFIDDDIEKFNSIYVETMERNQALKYYNFGKDFFEFFKTQLKNNSFYYFAKNKFEIISTELVLLSSEYGHSYLGGTDSNYFNLCPNNLLKHGIIKELKRRGVKYFILGGGYKKNDGIFKYKKSFNEEGVLDFYIGKKIHDIKVYNKLVEEYEENYPEKKDINNGFFPLYRR
ncbi:GNAT family N-acetyltransferase [Psychrilyobacter atlanticus]|uniref:GNAT family N-acetyltransferase n=1 Tax=Psychrilyobacter atlanticus TaxID=271091 RepID=UPI00041D8213|nr:GNAT family N-acetyltransferase [Psychrilyobacter atlanticus]